MERLRPQDGTPPMLLLMKAQSVPKDSAPFALRHVHRRFLSATMTFLLPTSCLQPYDETLPRGQYDGFYSQFKPLFLQLVPTHCT